MKPRVESSASLAVRSGSRSSEAPVPELRTKTLITLLGCGGRVGWFLHDRAALPHRGSPRAAKTRAGVRAIAFPVELLPTVTAHLEHFVAPGALSHVFTGALGGQLRRSNFHEVWGRARKKAGIGEDVHFHDLRHTGNTLAANAGASTRELMTRMGHSSTRAALIYQHMTAGRDRVIADKLGQMIKEAREAGQSPPSGT